nr:MAG TPA: hypothetical protein [Bacteriophage sp.]
MNLNLIQKMQGVSRNSCDPRIFLMFQISENQNQKLGYLLQPHSLSIFVILQEQLALLLVLYLRTTTGYHQISIRHAKLACCYPYIHLAHLYYYIQCSELPV